LNYSDADFDEVVNRIIIGAQEMQRDGWWWQDSQLTNKLIKRRVLNELIAVKFGI
jgi:glutamate-1-semialdehyde 2,1-aminomutase